MSRNKRTARAFALYEVLLGLTIFVVGVLTLGRSVENCLNASTLNSEDERVRLILANRMAEIQATPGFPDAKKETKLSTGYGEVRLVQRSVAAGLKDDKNFEMTGINRVTLQAEWNRGGAAQTRKIEFYVFRGG
jgi:Tfp pilus assembly protein PilV